MHISSHYILLAKRLVTRLALCSFVVIMLMSCDDVKHKIQTTSINTNSAPYEMLIVANKQWLATERGKEFTEAVSPFIEGLPQREPSFRVTSVDPANFTGTFTRYAKVVKVDIDRRYKQPVMQIEEDVYIKSQVIVTLHVANNDALMAYVDEVKEQIVSMFNKQEFDRERLLLQKQYSGEVRSVAKEMFGIDILAPKEIDNSKRGKSFMWASDSKQSFRLNVCIYSLPLCDINKDVFIAKRDSVMKVNIPGEREDQWMETSAITVSLDTVTLQNQSCVVARGLWDMRNDAMGGPFVSYIFNDVENKRSIFVEGFSFAPQEKKRPIIRKLEAMLQTVRINLENNK